MVKIFCDGILVVLYFRWFKFYVMRIFVVKIIWEVLLYVMFLVWVYIFSNRIESRCLCVKRNNLFFENVFYKLRIIFRYIVYVVL